MRNRAVAPPHGAGVQQWRSTSAVPASGRAAPPLVLVLDLDETLIRPKIHGFHKYELPKVDHEVTIDIKDGVLCSISLRPGLAAFRDWIRRRRNEGLLEGPWLFAQGARCYLDAVLPKVDVDGDIFEQRILSKESCIKTKSPWVLKDLRRVPCTSSESGLARVVLVDNNVVSCMMCPENTLLIRDWLGAGDVDGELQRVAARLDSLITGEEASAERGDYAGALAASTRGFAEYKLQLQALRPRLDEEPPSGTSMSQFHKMLWEEALVAKRQLLGLGPSEC